MSSLYNDTKVEQFSSAIAAIADEKEREILQQAEERRARLIQQAEERVRREMDYLYQERLADIRDAASGERSLRVNRLRTQLFQERQDYAERIFQAAEERIRAFSGSGAYPDFLSSVAMHLAMQHDCRDAEISLRAEDMALSKELAIIFADSCHFKASTEIRLGGLLLWLPHQKMIIDERLETRLQEERSWFYSHSGLSAAW